MFPSHYRSCAPKQEAVPAIALLVRLRQPLAGHRVDTAQSRGQPPLSTSFGGWLRVAGSLTLASTALATPARADVIDDWHDRAVAAVYATHQSPVAQGRTVTMVDLAMFEALNAISPRYRPYLTQLPASPQASAQVAAAKAAHDVLVSLCPTQTVALGEALQAALATERDDDARRDGEALGARAAAVLLANRRNDGSDRPDEYRPATAPGTYVPTVLPAASQWGLVRPFALAEGAQFRPGAPYALTSEDWARDYNEVRRLGAKRNSGRSADQSQIASFWEMVGPATYSPLAQQVAGSRHLDLLGHARWLALVSMATSDTSIAVFDAKYAYGFWRPITAIRNGDRDGNDATPRDPSWEPFLPTPMHPEYPCAHCAVQGSAARVLELLGGNDIATVSLTSDTAPGAVRRYSRLTDYVAEVVNARIYGGMHYRRSGEVGVELGRRVAEEVVKRQLLPL
jgi:hypothetical protein